MTNQILKAARAFLYGAPIDLTCEELEAEAYRIAKADALPGTTQEQAFYEAVCKRNPEVSDLIEASRLQGQFEEELKDRRALHKAEARRTAEAHAEAYALPSDAALTPAVAEQRLSDLVREAANRMADSQPNTQLREALAWDEVLRTEEGQYLSVRMREGSR